MSQHLFDLIYPSESSEIRLQTVSSGSQDEANHQSSQFSDHEDESDHDLDVLFRAIAALLNSQNFISNIKALVSRFALLVRRPEHLAPLILDLYSLSLSILLSGRQPGVDFLYPMSSLKKRQSGRLARLILEHSRDLQQRNIHEATSSQEGIDPPCVAVVDLDEVPPHIIERGYNVPADIHGLTIMVMIFQTLLGLCLYIFAAVDARPLGGWVGDWVSRWFGEWFGSWSGYLVGHVYGVLFNWMAFYYIGLLCAYAIFRGDGVLTLVRRSGPFAPGYAVFLDREFTMILTGSQSVVEAIAESSFTISHPVSWRIHRKGWQLGQYFCYEVLKALCKGALFALFVGCWLLLHPPSRLVPLVLVTIMSLLSWPARFQELRDLARRRNFSGFMKQYWTEFTRCVCRILPSVLLLLVYELAVAEEPILRSIVRPTLLLQFAPLVPFAILLVSSRNFHIRTAKFLDILGNPPVRRWEFDTLAAAATFQCLVLCREIPRPIKTMDVLTLLDTLVPDQTDVWKVWKRRVADRITHEIEISFAPTLPSFGDQRQKHLKDLLDQAQLGYGVYRHFFDWHVPLYSTGLSTATS